MLTKALLPAGRPRVRQVTVRAEQFAGRRRTAPPVKRLHPGDRLLEAGRPGLPVPYPGVLQVEHLAALVAQLPGERLLGLVPYDHVVLTLDDQGGEPVAAQARVVRFEQLRNRGVVVLEGAARERLAKVVVVDAAGREGIERLRLIHTQLPGPVVEVAKPVTRKYRLGVEKLLAVILSVGQDNVGGVV